MAAAAAQREADAGADAKQRRAEEEADAALLHLNLLASAEADSTAAAAKQDTARKLAKPTRGRESPKPRLGENDKKAIATSEAVVQEEKDESILDELVEAMHAAGLSDDEVDAMFDRVAKEGGSIDRSVVEEVMEELQERIPNLDLHTIEVEDGNMSGSATASDEDTI